MDTLPVRPERMTALAKFLDYEAWFAQAVQDGLDAADRDEFIEHEEVGKLIEDRFRG